MKSDSITVKTITVNIINDKVIVTTDKPRYWLGDIQDIKSP